jgi:hypothetical protein
MAALSAGQTATLIWIVGPVVRFILSTEFIGQLERTLQELGPRQSPLRSGR